MTHLVIYVPKKGAREKNMDDLFPEDVISAVPSRSEIELVEEADGYNLITNFDNFPEKKDLRVALAHIDNHLGKLGVSEYKVWVGAEVLEINSLFYRTANGEDVTDLIDKELEKVYHNEL